jgi:DNA-binding response OmpR family regulator
MRIDEKKGGHVWIYVGANNSDVSEIGGLLARPTAVTDKPRALVVDDDDPIRTMLTKVIEHEDLDVDTARDGAEAITRLDEDGYRVILLDLMMPRVDGFAVLRYMQEHHPEKLRCTIIASAVPEGDIAKQVSGVRVHAKPFDIAKLLTQIRECIAAAA